MKICCIVDQGFDSMWCFTLHILRPWLEAPEGDLFPKASSGLLPNSLMLKKIICLMWHWLISSIYIIYFIAVLTPWLVILKCDLSLKISARSILKAIIIKAFVNLKLSLVNSCSQS